jgi:hypothetical protein
LLLLLTVLRYECWLVASAITKPISAFVDLLIVALSALVASTWVLLHWVTASPFYHCLLDVHSPTIDFSNLMVSYKIIRNVLLFESYKTKTSALACVDVFQNDCIYNFSELVKVVF